jgi:hypothetical protein
MLAVFNPPPHISQSTEMFLNKKNIINVSISRARDYMIILVPDEKTENIENLTLINRIENIFDDIGCKWFEAHDLENRMFGRADYLEENTFATSHQNVNVYGLPEKCYEVRSEDTAVDVQVHRAKAPQEDPMPKPTRRGENKEAAVPAEKQKKERDFRHQGQKATGTKILNRQEAVKKQVQPDGKTSNQQRAGQQKQVASKENTIQKGTALLHKIYGRGVVQTIEEKRIVVRFPGVEEEKRFAYPDAFREGHLKVASE